MQTNSDLKAQQCFINGAIFLRKPGAALALIALLWHCAAVPAWAEDRWYQIEVIIFQQDGKSTEIFDQTESTINWPKNRVELPEQAINLAMVNSAPPVNSRLQASDYLLQDIYYQLRRNQNYQPFYHEAWLQKVAENQLSDAVHIVEGPALHPRLDGFIRLQRGHYLHVLADIEYTPVNETIAVATDTQAKEPLIYHLKEKRRVKFNEVHYLDHPKFGVIVTVKALEFSPAADDE